MTKSCCTFNERYEGRFLRGSQGLVFDVGFTTRLATAQTTSNRCRGRSSCFGSLIRVLIGSISKAGKGVHKLLIVLGAPGLLRLGHGDRDISLGHIFHEGTLDLSDEI